MDHCNPLIVCNPHKYCTVQFKLDSFFHDRLLQGLFGRQVHGPLYCSNPLVVFNPHRYILDSFFSCGGTVRLLLMDRYRDHW